MSRFFAELVQVEVSHNFKFVDFFNISKTHDVNRNLLGLDFRDPYALSYVGLETKICFTDKLFEPKNGIVLRARYAIAYLALFGSVLGFFWYYFLLRKVGAVRVNLITLVTPVTALLLGNWLNDEVILPTVWVGTAFIMCGLAMHQWQMLRARVAQRA